MGVVIQANEETLLAHIERRLIDDFPQVPPSIVDAVVQQAHARFEGSRIREYVPLFVEKHAREQLTFILN